MGQKSDLALRLKVDDDRFEGQGKVERYIYLSQTLPELCESFSPICLLYSSSL